MGPKQHGCYCGGGIEVVQQHGLEPLIRSVSDLMMADDSDQQFRSCTDDEHRWLVVLTYVMPNYRDGELKLMHEKGLKDPNGNMRRTASECKTTGDVRSQSREEVRAT